MGLFSRALKNKTLRTGTESSLNKSADVPGSGGYASINNLQGASKASADVLHYLDGCFEELDSDDELLSNVEHIERQLIERARKYSNSGLPPGAGTEWHPSHDLLDFVRVAIECSVNVYNSSAAPPKLESFSFRKVKEINASVNGVTKAVGFYEVTHSSESSSNPNLPALVVAIRGTESSRDWMVNLNHEVSNVRDFLDFTSVLGPDERENAKIEAHAGFLNAVKALEKPIKAEIHKYLSSSIRHILFTGHSAGGAVASLAFMHVLGLAKEKFPQFRFSLITFGAPPITSQNLSRFVDEMMIQNNAGHALAIVNAHDPITRVDSSYIQSMTALYKEFAAARGKPEGPLQPWVFEPQTLHSFGSLIVLKDISGDDRIDVRSYNVEPKHFAELIFCDRKMHKKYTYLRNIRLLQGEELTEAELEELEGL